MIFSYKTTALISDDHLEQTAHALETFAAKLASIANTRDYLEPESSVVLPFDETVLAQTKKVAEQIRSNTLQYIVVIGIGGSNLAAQAVYETIAGSMHLLVDRLPKLLFLDTVSEEKMTAVTRTLERLPSKEDFALVIISKSGTTTETIANAEVLWDFLMEHFGDPSGRVVMITDEGSKLWNQAGKKIFRLAIPKKVGGRFSAFSAVGLLPLLLAGLDIEEMREGAREAVLDGTSSSLETNTALISACLTELHRRAGRTIHNTFLFCPKAETLGKWHRQLMGESIGKDGKGITPIVSIGSTDLHSMAQLYWDGPDDKFTNLIYSLAGNVNKVPQRLAFPGLVSDIQGKSLQQLMQAILGGIKSAYQTRQRPFSEIDLQGADVHKLGYYLQWRMLEMMYLAQLMQVNAFDQPAVELYKETTRKLLRG